MLIPIRLPILLLFLSIFFPASGIAAESSGPQSRQIVPVRTIQLKADKDVVWKAMWDQGRDLARSGRLIEAVSVYETMLAIREGLETARWELVTILRQLKREEAALPHLELLVETAPKNFQYLLALAEANKGQGNAVRAAELFKKVLQLEPANLQALRGAASALLAQQKKAEAAILLETLLQQESSRLSLREELGNLYYDLGLYDKARMHFSVLLREHPTDATILLKTAQAYDKSGLEHQAIEYWQRLARIHQSPEVKERLTAYYLKSGRGEDALVYLLPLVGKEPFSPRVLKRLGQIYVDLARFSEALAYFERYIFLKPEDKDVLLQVIDLHASIGNKHDVAGLGRGLGRDLFVNLENLERGAGQYEAAGELREAVALYDLVLAVTPDDQKILAKWARVLLAVGNNNEINAMWGRLEEREKLLEVLELMLKMEPENKTVIKKLARIHLDRGNLPQSLEMFVRLESLGVRTPEVLAGQALLYERLKLFAKALILYEQLVDVADGEGLYRLRCIQLAGELGLLRKTQGHLARLQEKFPRLYESPQNLLLIAKALTETASYTEARKYYLGILARSQTDDVVTAAFLGLAEGYRRSGLPYETEQVLRQAYLHQPGDRVVLGRLFSLALVEKRFAEAWVWLEQLSTLAKKEKDQVGEIYLSPDSLVPAIFEPRLLRARLLAAEGETGKAVKIVRLLVGELTDKMARGSLSPGALPTREVDLLLARLLFVDGRYTEAEQLLLSLADLHGSFEVELLLLSLYRTQGKSREEKILLQRLQAAFSQDQSLVFNLLKALQDENLQGPQLADLGEIVALARQQYPESVTLRYWSAWILEAKGETGAALEIWQDIARDFPEQELASVRFAQLLFNRGRFVEARAAVKRLPHLAARADMILLKARLLWAEHEWEKALVVYDDFLKPSVAEAIAVQAREQGLSLPEDESPDLWTRLTGAELNRQTVLDALMAPKIVFESGPGATALNQVLIPFYARYRWHKQLSLEKIARQAVLQREYLAAANYFRILLRDYPGDASLQFDLAGIYSRFGQLGHEAALYEEIGAAGVDFPGLTEAIERNELKRQPRVVLGYGYLREEGRGGYKAIKKSWTGTSLQYSPYLQHDLEVNLTRLNYQNPDGNGKIRGSRALVSYAANINEHLVLRGGAGAEMLANSQPDTTLLELSAEGRFGDRLTGILSYARDVKHDTLASLGRNIVQQDYRADLVLDMVPSIQAGGGYLRASLSDKNIIKGYDLWAAYLLFFEPAFLKFSYTYDFKDTAEGKGGGPLRADGFAAFDHPYWTPMHYWQNRFSVYFKHQLSGDQFLRGVPRYYNLEYALVYDEMGYAMQTLKGGFFVEYAPRVIFSATSELTSGPDYRAKEFFLSAIYRW